MNEEGRYKEEAGPKLKGKYVLSEGTREILELIKSDLMHLGEIIHSYPYDWRTKEPVIIRASQQWFIDTNAIKARAVVSLFLFFLIMHTVILSIMVYPLFIPTNLLEIWNT